MKETNPLTTNSGNTLLSLLFLSQAYKMQDLKRNVGISTGEGMGTKMSQKNPQALFIVVFSPRHHHRRVSRSSVPRCCLMRHRPLEVYSHSGSYFCGTLAGSISTTGCYSSRERTAFASHDPVLSMWLLGEMSLVLNYNSSRASIRSLTGEKRQAWISSSQQAPASDETTF